jgi:hypothetical protein
MVPAIAAANAYCTQCQFEGGQKRPSGPPSPINRWGYPVSPYFIKKNQFKKPSMANWPITQKTRLKEGQQQLSGHQVLLTKEASRKDQTITREGWKHNKRNQTHNK